jgi:hypothetical protein
LQIVDTAGSARIRHIAASSIMDFAFIIAAASRLTGCSLCRESSASVNLRLERASGVNRD